MVKPPWITEQCQTHVCLDDNHVDTDIKLLDDGLVVITRNSRTGLICDDDFGILDAKVVCTSLGFGYIIFTSDLMTFNFFIKCFETLG